MPITLTYLRFIISVTLVLLLPLTMWAQFNEDYEPLVNSGSVPAIFSADPIAKTEANMASNVVLDENQARTFYSKVNFLSRQILQSGNIYLNNALTFYVDSIVNRLLATGLNLPGHVNVFVSRFTDQNALCLPDGTIIVNIGLLEILENEAELAFILAHEIGHFAESHSAKDLKRLTEIQKRESNFNSRASSAYRSLQFSRDSEFDADFWALQLVQQAGYDLYSAIGALSKLKSEPAAKRSKLNLSDFFENELFQIDTNWVNDKALKRATRMFTKNNESRIASGKMDDIFQTHPDIEKRVEALSSMAETLTKTFEQTTVTENRSMGRIKKIAQFEMVENYMRMQNYLDALESSLILLEEYPENIYLNASVARSLHWISYYKEINNGKVTGNGSKDDKSADYLQLVALMNEMGLADAKKLAYSYSKTLKSKNEQNEDYCFYYALNTEHYLGKNLAKVLYQEYILKFPNGNYLNFVKSKF